MGSDEPAHGSPYWLAQHSPIFVCVQYGILKSCEYLYVPALELFITLNCKMLLLANI